MIVTLKPKKEIRVPIDARNLSPDVFQGKSRSELGKEEVLYGNHWLPINRLFDIDVDERGEDVTLKLSGNLSRVRFIGANMSMGTVIIDGAVGMHLGERMEGGSIIVNGDADSWLGSMMRGGRIEIKGNAGDYTGAAYRGSAEGMSGGEIIIHGNAGNETGLFMRKGVIKIGGNVGQFTGIHMIKGTILVQGDSLGRDGAEMKGGKIAILGHVESVLPTFTIEGVKKKVKIGDESIQGPFYVFEGDTAEHGLGKLYIAVDSNPQLKFYEKYI